MERAENSWNRLENAEMGWNRLEQADIGWNILKLPVYGCKQQKLVDAAVNGLTWMAMAKYGWK